MIGIDRAANRQVDPKLAETVWCVYAWPVEPTPDARAFFTNHASVLAVGANLENHGTQGVGNPLEGVAYDSGAVYLY